MKYFWPECGGKGPNIVLNDADLEKAAERTATAICFHQGEVCVAPSRLIASEKIHDEFMQVVLDAARDITPGDPLDPDTKLGALVEKNHLARVEGFVEMGREKGAKPVLGGDRPNANQGGCCLNPTILDDVTNDMTIAREEIFAPVLSTITVNSDDEAVAAANDTDHGLGAALWGSDVLRIHKIVRSLRTGTVRVTNHDHIDITLPFGCYKQSGNGQDKSLHASDKYFELRTTWIEL